MVRLFHRNGFGDLFGIYLKHTFVVCLGDFYFYAFGVKLVARLGDLFKLFHYPAADGYRVAAGINSEQLVKALAFGKSGYKISFSLTSDISCIGVFT